MVPILFTKDATVFTTNGIGRLTDTLSCRVTEERNGVYEMEMTYLAGGIFYDQIDIGSIIVCKPFEDGTRQAFRVYNITKPLNQVVTIQANHISYDLSYIPVRPFGATGITATLTGLRANAMEECLFSFVTHGIGNEETAYNMTIPKSMRACLGGTQGSVLDVFSGSGGIEYLWDNYTVNLYRNRGSDTGFQLRYGKNITGLELQNNGADIYTGVVPYYANEEQNIVLIGATQYSTVAPLYPYNRTQIVDVSGEFSATPTITELNEAGYKIAQAQAGLLQTNVKVNFVALWQTENYRDVAPLEKVKLCDTVRVIVPDLGISYSAKVIKTVFDVLKERYESIEIGDTASSLSKTLAGQIGDVSSLINRQDKIVSFVRQIDLENGEFRQTISEQYENLDRQVDGLDTTVNGSGGLVAQMTDIQQNGAKISLSARQEILQTASNTAKGYADDVQGNLDDTNERVTSLETTMSVTPQGVSINQGTDGNYVLITDAGLNIYVDNTIQAMATKDGFIATNFMTGDWHIEPYGSNVLNFYKRRS